MNTKHRVGVGDAGVGDMGRCGEKEVSPLERNTLLRGTVLTEMITEFAG